jgi:hypothetical protein
MRGIGAQVMESNRRSFIRHSLAVLGTVAAGGAAAKQIASATNATPEAAPTGPVTPALTPDHQVVHHQCGKVVSLPVVNTKVRHGIPGKKFVMVIDLSKCDGCGACTVACGKMHFIPPQRQWIKVLRMQDSESTAP